MFTLKKLARVGALFGALAVAAGTAQAAATISFGSAVINGSNVDVDVIVSNLGSDIVSAYDLDVTFDTSALSFGNVLFSNALGDVSLFEVINSIGAGGPGLVDFAAVSLLSDSDLWNLQNGGPVTLATLEFVGSDASSLAFANWGPANDVKGRRNQVIIPGNVPEPASLALVAIALAGLGAPAVLRRRRDTESA